MGQVKGSRICRAPTVRQLSRGFQFLRRTPPTRERRGRRQERCASGQHDGTNRAPAAAHLSQ